MLALVDHTLEEGVLTALLSMLIHPPPLCQSDPDLLDELSKVRWII